MSLSRLAFAYRPVVFMMAAVLMAYGAISYFRLPAKEDPSITIREAVVTTAYPGLSPERIERLVTKTIEEAIRQVPEIEKIRSTSMAGLSVVHAEVDDAFFDLDQIWDDMAAKVEEAGRRLPEGAGEPFVNDDFGDVAVITAAITAGDWAMRDAYDVAEHVRDRLYAVPGTKRVELHGAPAERVFVETSNARLAEIGLDPDALIATLREQNVILPGGEIETGGVSFVVQPTGNFESVEAIRETLIRLPGGQVIPLRDVAEVRRGYVDPPQTLAFWNGEPAIVLSVAMLDGFSVLDFAERARAALEEIEAGLPVGFELDIVTYQATQVERAVYGVTWSVLQTLGIVLAVVVLFLGARTGLIVGSIVPAVMLTTIAIMAFAGMALERMSLATLIIALGLLVDNGIVVAEDFKRRLEEGMSRDAALDVAGRELAPPLLSSTLTTVLVFLPLMLADHVSGEYTRSISLVVLIALTTSWVFAMALTPVLCHLFMADPGPGRPPEEGRGRKPGGVFARLERAYGRIVRRLLRARLLFLGAMLLGLAGGAALVASAPARFFPQSDRPQVMVYVDLPAGSTTRATAETMRALAERFDDRERLPHVESHVEYVGFGGPRFVLSLTPIDPHPNKGVALLEIDAYENVQPTIGTIRALIAESFPNVRASVTNMYLGPSDSTKIELQVKGPDAGFLYATARELERELARIPGAIDVSNDWENRISKIIVDVDQARARRAGVASRDVAESLARYFSGRSVSEFREGDDIFPIVARAESEERRDLDRMRTLAVHAGASGESVPLLQVADFRVESDFAFIQRENLERTITVEARNTRMTAEDMAPILEPALERLRAELPPGHAIEFDGVVTQSAQGRAALMANMPLCLGVIAVLLVAQFNSYLRPLVIVATIPLVVIGVGIGLHAMDADFGFMPILGLLSLAGIIVNNAIVLIDRIDIERAAGAEVDKAIMTAAMRRLRPIVMTTVTTILGLAPLILGRDALFYGMAVVIAFGLAVGTVLTLGVVPALYSLFFGGLRPSRRAAVSG